MRMMHERMMNVVGLPFEINFKAVVASYESETHAF